MFLKHLKPYKSLHLSHTHKYMWVTLVKYSKRLWGEMGLYAHTPSYGALLKHAVQNIKRILLMRALQENVASVW